MATDVVQPTGNPLVPTGASRWPLLASIGIAVVAAIVAGVKNWGPLPWNVQLQNITPLLAPLIMAAAVIERSVEVFVSPWRDPKATELANALAAAKADAPPDAKKISDASQALDRYKGQTQRYAFGSSLMLSALAAAAGVRALGPFANLGPAPGDQHQFFTWVDLALSTALLAGGADGLHSVVNAVTSFADATAKKATS